MLIPKLLLLHFVADFLLQPREMAVNKSSDLLWLGGHLGIQFLVFLPFTSIWFALLNCAVHGAVDWYIWRGYKLSVLKRFPNAKTDFKFWEDSWFFNTIGLDQLLHGLTLVILAGWLL